MALFALCLAAFAILADGATARADDAATPALGPGAPLREVLAPDGGALRAGVDLHAAGSFRLSIAGRALWPRFSATLLRVDAGRHDRIWRRQARRGAIEDAHLALPAGHYLLQVKRQDARDDPAPLDIQLAPGPAPLAGHEIEPNDTVAMATPLPAAGLLRGRGGADDPDFVSFVVPDDAPEHLWRLFTLGAARLRLLDSAGRTVRDARATGRRLTADSLALAPGHYRVRIEADGPYVVKVMDLGPRPAGYEGEPNDRRLTAGRLDFGTPVRGSFHRAGDTDMFLFALDAPADVALTVTPPPEGATEAELLHGGHRWGTPVRFAPGAGPYRYAAHLPAGEWAVRMRAGKGESWGTYRVALDRRAAVTSGEPDNSLYAARAMPLSGDISGVVGGFDGADQILLPLPKGRGAAAITCAPATAHWAIWDWRMEHGRLSGRKRATPVGGMIAVPYGPDLGGALRLELDGGEAPGRYACHLRFAPQAWPEAAPLPGDRPLTPGHAVEVALAKGGRRTLRLALATGEVGVVGCRDAAGGILAPTDPAWRVTGGRIYRKATLGGLRMVRANGATGLDLRALGMARRFDCALLSIADLPRPADAGPPAEFHIARAAEAAGLSPGLATLLARKAPERQPMGDLPVTFALDAPPDLAAYRVDGQSFAVAATLTNAGATTLDLALEAGASDGGWRIGATPERLTLAPQASGRVRLKVVAPPWLSPVTRPGIVLTARARGDFAAAMVPVPVRAAAAPVAPVTYWQAPDGLRGGLNVLLYGLGARVISADGKVLDRRAQQALAPVHDGLAPYRGAPNVRALTFRLAAPSELAGAMVQLRSDGDTDAWPAEVSFETSADGKAWARTASGPLRAVPAPQYFPFDTPVQAGFLRVRFPRCRARRDACEVQEIQAIARPGTRPGTLRPINVAAPGLGGHVLYARPGFAGPWNGDFLTADPGHSNGGWGGRAKRRIMVVGFHQNRAARLASVRWIGHPKDRARLPFARVAASTGGPAGPWTDLGTLTAPPIGTPRATLAFAKPVWARYLRFTFPPPAARGQVGPDAIEALEAPGPSVLGLWQDDSPRAAFETATGQGPATVPAPAGGAGRATARPLPPGKTVRSSVLLDSNEDWWALTVPAGPPRRLTLRFATEPPRVAAVLEDAAGGPVALRPAGPDDPALQAVLTPGRYLLRIHEPPRSVVIAWDTSGSVAPFIPRTLAAVRLWGRSLKPGRDALNLLPFGAGKVLLRHFADTPKALAPWLSDLPQTASSDAEGTMRAAAEALAGRPGATGIVVITDAEAPYRADLWPALLSAMPRVVALSIGSDSRRNAAIMMDWAALNHGHFLRVDGPLGLADGMDMAAALFRGPKAYRMTAYLTEAAEPEGQATLAIAAPPAGTRPMPTGAVEVILDASGSMLQRLEGRRRIDIAHAALSRLVGQVLPPGTPFAFRAFGLEKDACRSELRLPLAPLDRAAATRAIRGVPAINLARTAIGASLLAARRDLAKAQGPRVILLVTDGKETCGGDPARAITDLRDAGLDVQVNIVGFAIDDRALAQTFAAWARAGHGAYFNADSPAALERAVTATFAPRFDIIRSFADGTRRRVGQAAPGATVTVPAGRLTLVPVGAARGKALDLHVAPDETVRLNYAAAAGLTRAKP